MFPKIWCCAGLAVLALSGSAATTVATVGDSFADSFYFGLRARPDLLKANDIALVRWSRPAIGLVRTDQFDYAGWLKESSELGVADYCVVQVGTNDMQSIPDGEGKWIFFPTGAWHAAYTGRVQGLAETLRTRRCRRVIWVLQPGFEGSKFLSRNRGLINEVQLAGVGSGSGMVLEIAAEKDDYGKDGIHFTGPFALKLADATLRIVTAWRGRVPESCFACHTTVSAPLPLDAAALRIRSAGPFTAMHIPLADAAAPRSVIPPPLVARVTARVVRRVAAHHRRRR